MPLKTGVVNPLAVFDIQRVSFKPPHFTPIYFKMTAPEKVITDWLYQNAESRFYFHRSEYTEPKDGLDNLELLVCVAFENEMEATLFALTLDAINVIPELN